MRLTTRGFATAGAGAGLMMLWWLLGDPELLLTAGFLLLATGAAAAYTRSSRAELRLARRISPVTLHAGDDARVRLEIDNLGPATMRRLEIVDEVEGLGRAKFEVARLDRERRAEARYQVRCRTRGVYRVGPTLVTASDPLGLSETELASGPVGRIVVFPRVEGLRGFPAVRGRDSAVDAPRPALGGQGGEEFYTLREYQTGDDIRRVHWPSSAKTDELLIRQLESPWRPRALVVLDIRSSAYESSHAFEKAVSGAASVITHLIGSGFDADLWSGDPRPVDASRYSAAMERLALIQPDDSVDIVAAATQISRREGGGALVLITGSPDEDLLGVHRLLGVEYPTTLLLTVASTTPQSLANFLRMGVSRISITPDEDWAEAWMATMDESWTVASR
jgi:uncharacterized protein (DUF58 family)